MIEGLNRVLVVGGGIGGMAAAIALRKRGVTVEIAELDPEWKVYGAGITITGPTLRAFRGLGLLDAIGEHGFLSVGAHMHLFDGTLLSTTEVPPIEPGLPSAGGIMRPKLHEIMSREVRGQGVDVRLGVTVDKVEQSDAGAAVTFTDGRTGTYDLIVAADGLFSKMRRLVVEQPVEPIYTGQMSWRVVSPRPPEMNVSHFYFGHSTTIAGTVPCSQTQVYSFILHPEPNPRRIPEDEKADFVKALLVDFGGDMARIRDGITPESSIIQRPFDYALQPRPWHAGRVVLMGDAAHATTAHLASGAGIAVEDALVLAEELERGAGDIQGALANYTERRFERCRFVVETSVGIGKRQMEHAPPQEIGATMGKAMHYLAQPI
jgi:2-polyprenyl-6-methoxyphenol hydroxylase-like FAD-dependent oxidoreductase